MRARLVCALVTVLLLPAALARADGDPASDMLLAQNVFYPYQPTVSSALQKELNAATAAAAREHFPIKVALIESKIDLGVITQLFGKPEAYARFLDQEISYPSPQPLLVVMAAGYGTQGLPAGAQAAVPSLRPPAGSGSDSLAEAALSAVRTLARADGHPLPVAGSGASAGRPTAEIVIGLAVVAILSATAVVTGRRRARVRRRARIRRRPPARRRAGVRRWSIRAPRRRRRIRGTGR